MSVICIKKSPKRAVRRNRGKMAFITNRRTDELPVGISRNATFVEASYSVGLTWQDLRIATTIRCAGDVSVVSIDMVNLETQSNAYNYDGYCSSR